MKAGFLVRYAKYRLFLFLMGLLLILPSAAAGHELWFKSTDDGWILFRGHALDHAHPGTADTPCPIEQFLQTTVIKPSGELQLVTSGKDFPASWPADTRVIAVTTSSGCWTKTPRGTVNRPRNQVDSPLTSWRSFESIKLIQSWDPALASPLGSSLEISPQEDPLKKRGSKLRVMVTQHGKPVEGAVVTYNGKPRGVTGSEGMINIRLKSSDRNSIRATVTIPMQDEEVDEIISTACLEFFLE